MRTASPTLLDVPAAPLVTTSMVCARVAAEAAVAAEEAAALGYDTSIWDVVEDAWNNMLADNIAGSRFAGNGAEEEAGWDDPELDAMAAQVQHEQHQHPQQQPPQPQHPQPQHPQQQQQGPSSSSSSEVMNRFSSSSGSSGSL